MNHIYCIVFNRSQGIWQVVSENARGEGKSGGRLKPAANRRSPSVLLRAATLVTALAAICGAQAAGAAPSITGTGDITPGLPLPSLPSWSVGGDLYLGNTGPGTLNISGGGTVTGSSSWIGMGVGGIGTATVSGPGSAWTNSLHLSVGYLGSGTVNIEDGGSVTNSTSDIVHGSVTVTGKGSTWINTDSQSVSSGTLNIKDGAMVSSGGRSLIAGAIGDTATATVSGEGSSWTTAGVLYVGNSGTGTLNIKDGATVSNLSSYVGANPDSKGAVTVSGKGARWTTTNEPTIGLSGQGALTIDGDGTVIAPTIKIAESRGAEGELNLNGNATSGRGVLETGKVQKGLGSATLNLNGGILQATRNEADYLSGIPKVAVGPEGAWLDTRGYDITVLSGFSSATGGSVNKLGTGTLILDGDSSGFTGNTHVQAGTLRVGIPNSGMMWGFTDVYGQLGGTLTIADGATLAGIGRVGTTTLQNGAILAPGSWFSSSSPGAVLPLRVLGDLNFAPGAIYRVEADPNSNASSLVTVTGTAHLAGSVVHVGPEGGFASARQYTILSANTLQGQFGTVSSNYAYLDPKLSYSVHDVTLELARKSVPDDPSVTPPVKPVDPSLTPSPRPMTFADAAKTGNQRATANGLESLATGNPLHEFILTLPAGAPPAVFDSLSGEIHASVSSLLTGSGTTTRTLPLAHLRTNLAAGLQPGAATAQASGALSAQALPTSNAQPAWAELVGNWQTLDGNGNAAKATQRTGGLFVGADHAVGGGWRVGAALGYTDGNIRIDDRNSKADVSSYSAAVYGGKSFDVGAGKLNVLAGTSYTWHNIDSERYATVAGASQKLTADYGANTTQLFTELGYAMALSDRASIEPFAGLAWSDMRTRGFSESGGSAALSGQSGSDKQTSTTLGARAQTAFTLGQTEGKLRATLGWRHAFGNVTPQSTMAFDGGQAFTVAGAPIARNAALAELGADLAISRNATVGLNYSGQYGGGNREHAGSVNVRWRY